MTTEELRAMTAQGPTVVLADRLSLLRLMDDCDAATRRAESAERQLRAVFVICMLGWSLIAWWVINRLIQWTGVI